MQKRKESILFICPYPLNSAPSQRFRFEQYFNYLTLAGFDLEIQPFFSDTAWKILYKKGNHLQKSLGLMCGFYTRLRSLFFLYRYDYIFIHREATPIGPPIFEFLSARVFQKKIIYDFDDAIWLANTSVENRLIAHLKWHSKVRSICRWSYKVSCGNRFLCDFAKQFNSNVVLNPTTVDTENLHNPQLFSDDRISNQITIGWTGTHSTLKYLNLLEPVFRSIQNKYAEKINILIIADKNPVLNIERFEFRRWSEKTEIQDLLSIDIGIMPLTDDIWAQGKCGFKALQFMALALPVIVSPVGVNTEIVDDNVNGYLCGSPACWEAKLEELINDQSLRNELGKAGRKKIIQHYSVTSNAFAVASLFS